MSRKAEKTGKTDRDELESGLTPKKARNAVRVAKVVVPAVVPVLAPIAFRAAAVAREAYDRYQARRMGVSVEELPEYTGHGGALLARIAGAAGGLTALRHSPTVTDDDLTFAGMSQRTLEQLSASVRAAERMPAPRRKAAHKAVAGQLDRIEDELLKRLAV